MISPRELIGAAALMRYDDDGEPVYTTHERVLLALRWFGWCSLERLYESLDADDYGDRQRLYKAAEYWVKRGRVVRRHDVSLLEYRLLAPSQWERGTACVRCPAMRVDGRTMCQRHLDWERDYKAQRRAA